MSFNLFQLLFAMIFTLMSSCAGYQFRSEKDSALLKEDIKSIYIKAMINDSHKSGVEHLIASNLKEKLQSSGGVRIVLEEKDADAVLEAHILKAQSRAVTAIPSENLYHPDVKNVAKALVGSEYEALLTCEFTLKKTEKTRGGLSPSERASALLEQNEKILSQNEPLKEEVKMEKTIFSKSFSNARRFLASNQKASYGTTSALITESEFDRALELLAKAQMLDVQDSLLSRF